MKHEIIERLSRYVKIDTQSDAVSETTPSTDKQWELLRLLEQEIKELGLEAAIDDKGYLMATLPANTDKEVPVIGLLAHVDTATDFTGTNVSPQVIENYDGKDITLKSGLVIDTKTFPELPDYKGHTMMTTDGTTLLGADNKAGITAIMEAVIYLQAHPEIKHGMIRFAFTPDEEIGRGPHHFDVKRFGADFAYTIDGGRLGELQYESFNAASAEVHFYGVNVHPGSAKDKMINALTLGIQFNSALPVDEVPEKTENYEGFYHLMAMEGSVEEAVLHYIIRDHDKAQFAARKALMEQAAKNIAGQYGEDKVKLTINDQYYNMGEKIMPHPELTEIPQEVMKELAIEPIIEPIRGGTDGSQLSYMGLPTPNIFTGADNFHGPYEYVSIDNLEKAVQTIVGIASKFEARS
ncbi:peptidase T [Macrococcus equipercicus]|uniref:Peptidase T n=1 Tax=Macrococcus equipercicus TaxID=69967 RepID=A0A9Q9BNE5_9STAP|nr:peptidase T [Macrococcus equipercicus]KAA1042444.1 peptidase T [Macrococcus equipercicus]UTH14330.1 peptidase T [Macrococcus equipercicus]